MALGEGLVQLNALIGICKGLIQLLQLLIGRGTVTRVFIYEIGRNQLRKKRGKEEGNNEEDL